MLIIRNGQVWYSLLMLSEFAMHFLQPDVTSKNSIKHCGHCQVCQNIWPPTVITLWWLQNR